MNIAIPTDDEIRKINADLLASIYKEGLERRAIIKTEMEYRLTHDRHFELKTFGNDRAEGIHPYRMNGVTGGRTYNEFYQDWRTKALDLLSSSTTPTHLRLGFMSTPDILVDKKFYYDGEKIIKVALETFDTTLEKLLDIISKLPATATDNSIQDAEKSEHHIRAEMEERGGKLWLVILLDDRRFVAKGGLRKGFAPYKVAKKIFSNHEMTVTNKSAGISEKRRMSDIAQEIGFSGVIHEKLLRSSVGTLRLQREARLTSSEFQNAFKICQAAFDME